MTREEIYDACLKGIGKSNCLLLEAATGLGKSKISIDLVNHLCDTVYKGKKTNILLLVAKTVHKQTWKDEFEKWGGIKVDTLCIECYESLRKHAGEHFTFVLMDEVHHVKSDVRLGILNTIKYNYMIGLSATIPRGLKFYFKTRHHSEIVSCNIIEAIEDDVLPEPEIILYPLDVDNKNYTETIELNPKAKGKVFKGDYMDYWKVKKHKVHAILKCTPRQKLNEMNNLITWQKNKYITSKNPVIEKMWLHQCGKRLEFLAYCKNDIVKSILKRLERFRTITFCKTIEQCEVLGSHCIHSKNKDASDIYNTFNKKKIKHITAVNILNENANLVDCKYAIFANLSSSEVVIPQRLGKL